jgi:predicted RNA-binding protein with PUA-like domain
MNYWLMKTEPGTYSIDSLAAMTDRTDRWEGIRNYQARNMLRNDMKKGDLAFIYHSSCVRIGIAGIIKIVRAAYPDATAFDPNIKYFDAKSDPDNPRWFMVDVCLVRKFSRIITLQELKQEKNLQGMRVLARGNRLSIMPVESEHWQYIIRLEKSAAPEENSFVDLQYK